MPAHLDGEVISKLSRTATNLLGPQVELRWDSKGAVSENEESMGNNNNKDTVTDEILIQKDNVLRYYSREYECYKMLQGLGISCNSSLECYLPLDLSMGIECGPSQICSCSPGFMPSQDRQFCMAEQTEFLQ
uniref:Uncharacterized protein n=1 Tax=Timema bartmani TaxID=61472 RepID=A0A7R9I6D8_9NEOP|nr:unnamed protein product [Timema bartmani]